GRRIVVKPPDPGRRQGNHAACPATDPGRRSRRGSAGAEQDGYRAKDHLHEDPMRILGIDRGGTSIKAVEVESSFGRYEIREEYEQAIEPTPDGSGAALALTKLIQGLPKPPDRIAVALPTGETTFRNLKLPTRDKKAIQSAVGFELDDELPFAVEDA